MLCPVGFYGQTLGGHQVPCLTYIREPVERLVSFYYWNFMYGRLPGCALCDRLQVLQTMEPQAALAKLRHTGMKEHFYHHMPLLTLFGGLTKRDVMRHNETAMEAAAVLARRHLQRCVVGDTWDSASTQVLLDAYFPWVASKLSPDAMPHSNTHRPAGSPEAAPLPAETEALIRRHYRIEFETYEFAKALHAAQVAHARTLQGAQP